MSEDYRGCTSAAAMLIDVNKIRMWNGFVLIDPEYEDVSKGGLILSKDQNDYLFGTVIAVGNKVKEDLVKGNRVIFKRHIGHSVVSNEKTYIALTEDEVYAVID